MTWTEISFEKAVTKAIEPLVKAENVVGSTFATIVNCAGRLTVMEEAHAALLENEDVRACLPGAYAEAARDLRALAARIEALAARMEVR